MTSTLATRAEVLRLCHALDAEALAEGQDQPAVVWATFTDRRALMLDLPRFYERRDHDVVVLVAPDAPRPPAGVTVLDVAADHPLAQVWEFGVVAGPYAAFMRAVAEGDPPTSRDSPDRPVEVSVVRGAGAVEELERRLLAVPLALSSDRLSQACRDLRSWPT